MTVRLALLGWVVLGALGCAGSTEGSVGDGAVEEGADLVGNEEDGGDTEDGDEEDRWDSDLSLIHI